MEQGNGGIGLKARPSITRRGFLGGASLAGVTAFTAGAVHAEPRLQGEPRRAYGERSAFEKSARSFGATNIAVTTGSSRTPLQDLYGIITPSSLHFERHHSGVPNIDPTQHELLLHGLVERPLKFSMEELRRFPSVSRVHFIECAGNAGREHRGDPGPTVQLSHGLVSCSEWSGVLLSTLLREAGLKDSARWIVAEGADASRHSRSIPIGKALDDVIVAYGQNGEAVRPEQGYPLRLVVPGWEGNVNVKWLHRLQVTDQPAMSRDEAASYTDLMPNGKARQFSFEMETNSVLTHPCGGQMLEGKGFHEISGLAWTGRGKIARVEASVDGGVSWRDAELQAPIYSKALTRFRLPWRWMGEETILQSRAEDETGYVQPTRDVLVATRGMKQGPDGFNHYHGIKPWKVTRDGSVTYV
jgi:sulfane dehydrogenase subunit SoxC